MFPLTPLALVACSSVVLALPNAKAHLQKRAITQDLLDAFTRFTNFSAGAYLPACPSPMGTNLVLQFSEDSTSTQGYITRDDTAKQIITVFRGSQQIQDFATDANQALTPLVSQGVTNTNNATAHTGFLGAYNSVASTILSTLQDQTSQFQDYALVTTGHSLGGSLASLAGVSIKSNFPDKDLTVYTFGQPRTGDPNYAQLAEQLIGGDNLFRCVHTFDGVPTSIPQSDGYRHHLTEFWQFQDPSTPENVKQCSGEEDPTCSDSIPSTGINAAHLEYFGQPIGLVENPAVCK